METCGPSSNTITPTFYSITNSCVTYSKDNAYGWGWARVYNSWYAYNAINVPPTLAATLTGSYWINSTSSSTGWAVNRYAIWLDPDCDWQIGRLNSGDELTISYVYNNTGAQRTIYLWVAWDNYFKVKFNGVTIVEVTDTEDTTHTQFDYIHLLPVTLKQWYNSFEALGRWDGSTNDAISFVLYDNTLAQLTAATSDANLNILFSTSSLADNGSRITEATCPEWYYLDTSSWVNNYVCRSNIGQCMTTATAMTTASCGSANGSWFTSAPTTNLCTVGTPSAVTWSQPWSWTCYDTDWWGKDVSCVTCDMNTWSTRSACSASCGGWTQTRTNQCGTVQSQSCNIQACCRGGLSGIYMASHYYTATNCWDAPACPTMHIRAGTVRWRSTGIDWSCGSAGLDTYRYVVCWTLFKAWYMCQWDTCVSSITMPSTYSRNSPSFMVGTYDYTSNTCANTHSVSSSVNSRGFAFMGNQNGYGQSYWSVPAW
jgi:hypothetical protein